MEEDEAVFKLPLLFNGLGANTQELCDVLTLGIIKTSTSQPYINDVYNFLPEL
jgi:hypothetical protein